MKILKNIKYVSALLALVVAGCAGVSQKENAKLNIISKDGAKLYEFNVGQSRFLMNPEEGALLMRWQVKNPNGEVRDVIHWPSEDIVRGNINTVLGGAPVFFPFCGISSADGKVGFWKTPKGDVLPMRKFGFADNGNYKVVSVSPTEIVMQFVESDYSKKSYPFKYEFFVHYKFTPTSYKMSLRLKNNDSIAIPWGVGCHPFVTIPWNKGEKHSDYKLDFDCASAFYVNNAEGYLIPTDFENKRCDNQKMAARIHANLRSPVVNICSKSGKGDLTMIFNDGKLEPTFALVTFGKVDKTPFWAVEPWSVTPLSAGRHAPKVEAGKDGTFNVELKLK